MGLGAGVHGGASSPRARRKKWRRTRRRSPDATCRAGTPSPRRRGAPFVPGDDPACASSTRAATTCAASTSRSRSGSSPASPACPGRARARWSTTRCTPRSRQALTAATPNRRRTTRSKPGRAGQGHQRRPEPDRRTPRSNPATYTGLFTPIRELVRRGAGGARTRLRAGRFSFNVAGGRCEACQGDGVLKVEMHFLPDVYVPCDTCHGRRYNRETLEVLYKGRNITQVLDLTVEDALRALRRRPVDRAQAADAAGRRARLHPLGQSATTLSGGEAQRVKLALELACQARHRPHAVHPGRADDRPALRRHRPAAQGAAPAARRGQHHRRHRAQPGRHQDRRLDRRRRPPKAAPAAARSSPAARPRRWRRTPAATPDATAGCLSTQRGRPA